MTTMEENENILLENIKEYFEDAKQSFLKRRYNSAATLFFKTIAALCDLYILRKEGFIPSSHTDRFRILEEKFLVLYKIVDRDFPFYQNSYTQKLDEESARLLMEDAESIKKMLGI